MNAHEKEQHNEDVRILRAEVAGLKELLNERDRLYNERHEASKTAIAAALKAAEELMKAAFASSEKAIEKATIDSDKWRESANEWRGAMQDREAKFVSRNEMDGKIGNIEKDLLELRDAGLRNAGGVSRADQSRSNLQWLVGILVVFVLGVGAMIVTIMSMKK